MTKESIVPGIFVYTLSFETVIITFPINFASFITRTTTVYKRHLYNTYQVINEDIGRPYKW